MRRTFTAGVAALLGLAALAVAPAGAQTAGATDPDVYAFGTAADLGSTGDIELDSPIVDMAATPSGQGYWEVAADGGVFAYGDAPFLGGAGGLDLVSPIVAVVAAPDGAGYWLIAADGGVFSYGSAAFHGSIGGMPLAEPVVDGAATETGGGYWLAASDGGVFAFGDAGFHGSMGGVPLNEAVVGMAAAGDGGYWLGARDGGIFAFGTAGFFGSAGDVALNQPIVDIDAPSDGGGYWLAGADGGVFTYGTADFHGSLAQRDLDEDVVAIEGTDGGYWMATTGVSGQVPVGRPTTATRTSEGFPSPSGPVALLTDVRIGGHGGFDRIVFEFDGPVPEYQVGYVQPPIRADGSGHVVEVEGDAFLGVTFTPASGVDLSVDPYEETYTGPDRIDPPVVSRVEEIVQTGDFEAVLSWAIGLEQRLDFGVARLSDPSRLVIDVVHAR